MNVAVRIDGKTATGGLLLAGEQVVCDPDGTLFLPTLGILVVSDLHLEKGSSLARRGMMLPPYDTAVTLARLQAAIVRHNPRRVVSLGDSFHDRDASARLPQVFRDALDALMIGREWFWVSGNHDPEPPVGLGGEHVRELSLGGLVFRHDPSVHAGEGEIAGHLHPGARIVQRGRSVRRRCFATDGRRIVMPAFGSFTGSLNVLDRAFRGLLHADRLVAHMLGADRVYPISAGQLRPG
jgi:DNA ligase-associated metallophosphoesterase